MKKTLLWIAAILFVFGCAQKKDADKTYLGLGSQYGYFPEYLKGKVKEMHERNFWAVEQDGKFVKGKPMTWKDLDSLGTLKNTNEYFNEAGVLVKEDNIDENNIVKSSNIFTVENGKWTKIEWQTRDSSRAYFTPEFSTSGQFIGGKYYRTGKDTLLSSTVISYDEKGDYIKIEGFNLKNISTGRQEFTHDANHNVIEVRFINRKDTLIQKFNQTYNEKGFMTRQYVESYAPANKLVWNFTLLNTDDHGNSALFMQDIDNGKTRFLTERTFIYY